VIASVGLIREPATLSFATADMDDKPRLRALLDHFSIIEDPREPWRVAHPLAEILLVCVCATICECDDFDSIALWGETHLSFLRRYLTFHHGVPCGRWLNLLMNRINPALFSAAFTSWVRETWSDTLFLVAIDGKTSRRSHDGDANGPLHLVSAFAAMNRLVLGQEAVEGKSNELSAIPPLIRRLAEKGGLKGALISLDAIGTNAKIAGEIRRAGADYLLAVKANQPTLRAETEAAFESGEPAASDSFVEVDKGHGRIEQRTVEVVNEVDWLDGDRRFPGELRLPDAKCVIRVKSRAELSNRCRFETRYYISSSPLSAERAAEAVRGHWGIENRLHWVLDVSFNEDQSRVRKGHGATNMAIVRHFAINLVRSAKDKKSIRLRRKFAGWDPKYLTSLLGATAR
jgi:predicted transposase YbfD/YdcC